MTSARSISDFGHMAVVPQGDAFGHPIARRVGRLDALDVTTAPFEEIRIEIVALVAVLWKKDADGKVRGILRDILPALIRIGDKVAFLRDLSGKTEIEHARRDVEDRGALLGDN